MNDDFAQRLSVAYEHSSVNTKAELALAANISTQYLNKIFKGTADRQPPADIVQKLAHALEVDLIWLITGAGTPELKDNVKIAGSENSRCKPIMSYDVSLSCGNGCYQPSYEVTDESPVYFKESWFLKHNVTPEDCRRLKAHGDSMEPIITDGDFITVDCSLNARSHIENNKIYAIAIDNFLCCKYLIKLIDGGILIKSANPSYIDERLSAQEALDKLIIIGKVLDRSGDLS